MNDLHVWGWTLPLCVKIQTRTVATDALADITAWVPEESVLMVLEGLTVLRYETKRLSAARHVVYTREREQRSKFPHLKLLLSSSSGLSDTTKLEQVLPCLASGIGVFWLCLKGSCVFNYSTLFQTQFDTLIGSASHGHQSCEHQNERMYLLFYISNI